MHQQQFCAPKTYFEPGLYQLIIDARLNLIIGLWLQPDSVLDI